MKNFIIKVNDSESITVGAEENSTIDLALTWGVKSKSVKGNSDLIGYATTKIENDDGSKTIKFWNLHDLEEGTEITIKITKSGSLSPPSEEKTIFKDKNNEK